MKFIFLIPTLSLFIISQSHAEDAHQPADSNPVASCEGSVLAPQYGPPAPFALTDEVSERFINDSAPVMAGYEDGQTVYLNLSVSVAEELSLAQAGLDLQNLFASAKLPIAAGFSIPVDPPHLFFKLEIHTTAARDAFISTLAKIDPKLNVRVYALRLSAKL